MPVRARRRPGSPTTFGIPAISTGDIFRANIKNETPLGLQVKEVLASGGYVTDEITNAIVRDRLFEDDAEQGFLLDGFPRTAAQVETLDAILAEHGHQLEAVLELTVDDEAVVQRLLKRAEIEGREDDTEEVIRERQAIYRRETAPLTEVYSARGLLRAGRRHGFGRRGLHPHLRGPRRGCSLLMFGRSRIDTKTPDQILRMRKAGLVVGQTLQLMAQTVRPGMTTKQLDELAEEHIRGCGATPSFLGYHGFTGSLCTSVNDEVVHGIPGRAGAGRG